MKKTCICLVALLWGLSESRPCLSVPAVPEGKELRYRLSSDSLVPDKTGNPVVAFVVTFRSIRYQDGIFRIADSTALTPRDAGVRLDETMRVRRDSTRQLPREFDACAYVDVLDTAMAYEGDSLLIRFVSGQPAIKMIFSRDEGLLYYNSLMTDSTFRFAMRSDEESRLKIAFVLTAGERGDGLAGPVRRREKPAPAWFPGFPFGNSRFDASGRYLPSQKPR